MIGNHSKSAAKAFSEKVDLNIVEFLMFDEVSQIRAFRDAERRISLFEKIGYKAYSVEGKDFDKLYKRYFAN